MQKTESGQNQRRAFNKAVGSEKKYKLINLGPTFIPDYRVHTYVTVYSVFFLKKENILLEKIVYSRLQYNIRENMWLFVTYDFFFLIYIYLIAASYIQLNPYIFEQFWKRIAKITFLCILNFPPSFKFKALSIYFLVSYLQNVLRELEQKKPQLDDLVKTAENLRESPIRQQIPEKGKFTTD